MNKEILCVPLYFKSEYSLLQSTCKIEPSIKLAKEYGYHSLAITDCGTMYGALKFYHACKKENIKPIIGLKIEYIYNDKTSKLLLYAMNSFGYRNLLKISSQSKINNDYLPLEYLLENSVGLLAIIPSMENIIFRYLEQNDEKNALNHYNLLHTIFSDIYLGLSQATKTEQQLGRLFYQFGQKHQIQMVACMPISYLHLNDVDAYQTVISIARGGTLTKLTESEHNQYLYSLDEMILLYQEHPELLENTVKIANKCQLEITFTNYLLPKYDDNIDGNVFLKELCIKGLKKRLSQKTVTNTTDYEKRLLYELDVIEKMGFSDYFLIVWDYVKFAKKNKIFVGPGRGSAPASLVSYSLGITDVDPLYYGLLFERFLNPERITMPDIDIDFPDNQRDVVIRYIGEKYGFNRVAHICTFGTFKIKLALRDVARVYKISDNTLNHVMKEINKIDKKSLALNQIDLKTLITQSESLVNLMNDYEEIDQLLTIACKIEGLPRNISTHAAGIIITNFDLINYTALENGLDGIYQTQYEASDLESLGLLKMDLLGLKNLTIIDNCVKAIQQEIPTFTLPKEYNDPRTFQMLASGDVDGVFQLESDGMRRVIMDLKVSTFDDIQHAIALYRPGPMSIIPNFIKRKFKEEEISYPHPDLENILKDTYGMIVYQDQIMLIAHQFAKYSLGEADVLRRAVSKKKKDVLETERVKFVSSSVKAGYEEKVANDIYDYIVKFADYGFNKAHSVAYAQIAYFTAYLKCHYFVYYLAILMSNFIGSEKDISRYYNTAFKKNIKVLPPHINLSEDEFVVNNNQIIFPLSVIKGLGIVKTKAILEERQKGQFQDYEDFVLRVNKLIPFALIENIIYSGALDQFALTKKAMVDNYQTIINRQEYDFIKTIEKSYSDEEFTYQELLRKEKEIIGINISYNFFYQFQSLYQERNLIKIEDIQNNIRIRTLGMLTKVRNIKTKKGDAMAFMLIEDENSQIELVVFPEIYKALPPLTNGQLIIVIGKGQQREKLQIIVEEIEKV